MLVLCHSDTVVASEALLDDIMRGIYQGMRSLEVKVQHLHERGVNIGSISGMLPLCDMLCLKVCQAQHKPHFCRLQMSDTV
jgi:hypothetical protein